MDNLLVWIVVFAGAALTLLGVFLVASERELKVKRREVEELLAKLETTPSENSGAQSATVRSDNAAELTDLREKNQELQNQLDAQSGKLESSRRTIDEFAASERGAANERAENQQLRSANDQLKAETNELRNRLQANAARVIDSSPDQATAGDNRLQNEIMDLQRKLDESQFKLREFNSLQQKAAKAEALEASHREDRQILQNRIADLERELSNSQEKIRELESLKDRLAESERSQEALREESRRHEEEIVGWQKRIAAGEENRRRLAALQEPYNELISKQASLAEQQREFEEKLAGLARMIASPARENP
jgi:predicted RNase H-like nuclease (RuvC/YqgF family)